MLDRLALERGDLAGFARPQIPARRIEERRVDRTKPGRRDRDQYQQHEDHAADAHRPVIRNFQ